MEKETRKIVSNAAGTIAGFCSAKMVEKVIQFYIPAENLKVNPIVWALGTWGLYSASGMLAGKAVSKDVASLIDTICDAKDLWKSMKKEAEDGGSIDAGQQPTETE